MDGGKIVKWIVVGSMAVMGALNMTSPVNLQQYVPDQLATETAKLVLAGVLLVGAYLVAAKKID